MQLQVQFNLLFSVLTQFQTQVSFSKILCYRDTSDIVEKEGVRRAVNRSQEADLLLIMLSVTDLRNVHDYEMEIKDNVTQLLTEHLTVGTHI